MQTFKKATAQIEDILARAETAQIGDVSPENNPPSSATALIALSAEGSETVAAAVGGGIYTSTNFGGIWQATTAPVTTQRNRSR